MDDEHHEVIEMMERAGGQREGKISRAVNGTVSTLLARLSMGAIAVMFPLYWTGQSSWQNGMSEKISKFDVIVEQLKSQNAILTQQVLDNDKQINVRVDGLDKSITSRFDQQGVRVTQMWEAIEKLRDRFMVPFNGGAR